MSTKADEVKALEKITNIVYELGENSYVAAAFKGCFDAAEQNINNDWLLSPIDDVESVRNRNRDLERRLCEFKEDFTLMRERIEGLKEDLNAADEKCIAYADEKNSLNAKIDDLELENIKLKARLYDLMVEQEG